MRLVADYWLSTTAPDATAYFDLRELVCNSRNPDPRRVRKGGSELRPMTPFPGIPGIPRIPGIPGIEPRLQNGMPNFVRRRGS